MEGDRRVICYTRIIRDVPGFHKDLEQYEIYNRGHESDEEFIHRQELELRICREIFLEEAMILESKQYDIHNVIGRL